jgi:hypothetical protein
MASRYLGRRSRHVVYGPLGPRVSVVIQMIGRAMAWLIWAVRGRREMVAERVERVDKESREVRHDFKNVQSGADLLHRLISRMRDDGSFERRDRPS